jgi:hypothetical protein
MNNAEKIRKSHSRFKVRKRTYKYTDDVKWVLSYPERLTIGDTWTTMHHERKVQSSKDPSDISDEILRLNKVAIKTYQKNKQQAAERKAKLERDIQRRKDRLGKLYNFIDKKFEYLFDVYHDLKPKDKHVTRRGRDFCYRSKPKSFASFVLSHLRKKDRQEKLQTIYTKAENLGLSRGDLAAL